MPLTLGIKPGHSFYVGDTKVEVSEVLGPHKFKVTVYEQTMNRIFTVTDQRSTEVMPNVLLSTGLNSSPELMRVVVEAPRHIRVLREKLYLRAQAQCGERSAHVG